MKEQICEKCGSKEVVPIASNWLSPITNLPLWHCQNCQLEWGRTENEIDDAKKMEQQIIEYLKKHPDDKARLMTIIKNF